MTGASSRSDQSGSALLRSTAAAIRCAVLTCVLLTSTVAGEVGYSGTAPPSTGVCATVWGSYDIVEVLTEGVNGATEAGQSFPNVTNVEECCTACKNYEDCNVWNFCGQEKGCGPCFDKHYNDGKAQDKTCPKGKERRPKNWCTFRKAEGVYEFETVKAADSGGPLSFLSGKIQSKAPKHPPAVANEWKCSIPYYCNYIPNCNEKPKCPPKKCNAVRGLYETPKILDIEVNSHGYAGGPNHPPAVTSAASCCAECSYRKGCNVWNYCWDPAGCGAPGSCTAYRKKNPLLGTSGQFTAGCNSEGRFPKDFCILRKAGSDLTTLKAKNPSKFYSWTSGKTA